MALTKTDMLSLQLRSMTNLRKLTRAEFFTRLQLTPVIEPIVDQAFRISEEKILREQLDNEPHGSPWHVSFHASQFPGDDPMACPRQSLYRMMDFPPSEPTSRMLRQTADSGKAAEVTLVEAFHRAGILLSSPDPEKQTAFAVRDAWLTGSVDAIILRPGTNRPLPIEIKERKADVIKEMKLGRGPFPDHVKQIKVQIALIRKYQQASVWLHEYDLCTHGYIYYVSRDFPLDTAEFRVDHDEDFFVAGTEKLKRYRAFFEEDHLPELNPGKRTSKFGHPNGWKWSYPPCQWCDFKKTCQLDFREGNTDLSNSIGVGRARLIRKNYDPEAARQRVKEFWS